MFFQTIHESDTQLIKILAIFPIGRQNESKRALVQSMTAMLRKATISKANKELQEAIDFYGASMEIYSSSLYITAEMNCLAKFTEPVLDLLFEVLFEAKFDEDDWVTISNILKENILQSQHQTDYWAERNLSLNLYGKNHILGYYTNTQDYDDISISDIRSFYSTYLSNCCPKFFLAGELPKNTESYIASLVTKYKLADTKSTYAATTIKSSGNYCSYKLENASQASVRMAIAVPRTCFEDFLKIEIWSMFLGGHYMSELMILLRQKLGLTYGVHSHCVHHAHTSILHIGFDTDSKNVDISLKKINNLFKRLNSENKLDLTDAINQYRSQYSRNSEKALTEILYQVRLARLGYNYSEYQKFMLGSDSTILNKMENIQGCIFDFGQYNKSIAY